MIGILADALPETESNLLRSLDIWDTFIGKDDVEMLARILNSNSSLEELTLCSCNIQNEGVIALAESLANNCTLKTLDLSNWGRPDSANVISTEGWSALAKTLCDTSSVNNTYLSNHTLDNVGINGRKLPGDVKLYLEMNKCTNKQLVGRKKILKNHCHFDVKPLIVMSTGEEDEFSLGMLPLIISWLERVAPFSDHQFGENGTIEMRKLRVVYDFIHAIPESFIEAYRKHNLQLRAEQLNLHQKIHKLSQQVG